MLCGVDVLFVNGVILSMLGNRCNDDGDCDDVEGKENGASFDTDVEGSLALVGSWIVSPNESIFWSSEGAGATGMKNLAPIAGFTYGAAGDWKEFVKAPPPPPTPPLLKVSTYLNEYKCNRRKSFPRVKCT